ncbi:FAD-binding protein [Cognatishimia sp. WU-CL00825]|uniref:FAD-binding protein n=1 Tax=Cognatishimia sp. WU-CL00825 TaxID=3127658 RepID=UPI00310B0B67
MNPQSEQDICDAISAATSAMLVQGGGTKAVEIDNTSVLQTNGISGVSLYEPGSLTLVAAAGTPLNEIERLLDTEGQRLAFEPSDFRGLLGTKGLPTLGGTVASNASGPRRVAVGACRDHMLGVRFVDGRGRVLSNGGRVMKNVTGYDLVKLLSGSWGTLGVLTEISLKVLPKPEAVGVLLFNGLSDAQAIQAMSRALGSPYEVTGAAHTPAGVDNHPVTMLRVEGFEDSVSYRLSALKSHLKIAADSIFERSSERTSAGWKWVRDVKLFHDQPGHVWSVSVRPSDAADLVERVQPNKVLYDWGGGRIWLLTSVDQDVRKSMAGLEGHATLWRGQGFQKFHPQAAPIAALTRGLREKFDPRNILNPGLMD